MPRFSREPPMEANPIRQKIADLAERIEALRRYL
jgi:hypothetical protein